MEISQEHTTDVCWTGISIFSQLVMNGPGWMLDLLYRARCWVVFLFADMTDVIFLFPGPWSGHSCQITFENSTSVLFVPPGFPWVKLNPILFSLPWWNCGRYWSSLILQSWLERSVLVRYWPSTLTGPHTWQWPPDNCLTEVKIIWELYQILWGYLEHSLYQGRTGNSLFWFLENIQFLVNIYIWSQSVRSGGMEGKG